MTRRYSAFLLRHFIPPQAIGVRPSTLAA